MIYPSWLSRSLFMHSPIVLPVFLQCPNPTYSPCTETMYLYAGSILQVAVTSYWTISLRLSRVYIFSCVCICSSNYLCALNASYMKETTGAVVEDGRQVFREQANEAFCREENLRSKFLMFCSILLFGLCFLLLLYKNRHNTVKKKIRQNKVTGSKKM